MSSQKTGKISQISQIVEHLEGKAPLSTAESWDNVGLLIGDPQEVTPGVILSIDLSPEAVDQALKKGYRLIINHHPCIFPKGKGLNRFVKSSDRTSERLTDLMFRCVREGISVYATHTNFDRSSLEVVHKVSKALGAQPLGRLGGSEEELLKLVTFVPEEHLDKVRQAVCDAGAGHIGRYDRCTFSSLGEGTFRGGEGTQPAVGKAGRFEKAQEYRLETVFPKGLKSAVLAALRESHPYEEIAYDLYPMVQEVQCKVLVSGLGYGLVGEWTQPLAFPEFLSRLNSTFKLSGYQTVGTPPSQVKKFAFSAGKGNSFIESALRSKCDLYITGEVGYHAAMNARRLGMTVLEIGHPQSEIFFLEVLGDWLKEIGMESVPLSSGLNQVYRFQAEGLL